MKTYKVYTGPTRVESVANRLRDSGRVVKLEGTEHVYVLAESPKAILTALNSWTARDIQEMPE